MSKKAVDKTVHLDLFGIENNSYIILARFKQQATSEGWSTEEIDLVLEEAQSKDYNHLLATILAYCQSENKD